MYRTEGCYSTLSLSLATLSPLPSDTRGRPLQPCSYHRPQQLQVILSRDVGIKADVWSLGGTVLQMATGNAPWKTLNFTNVTALLFHIANTNEAPPIPR